MKDTTIDLAEGWMFPYPPSKPSQQMNPITLAYIGDAIYEVMVRQWILSQPNHRPHHMHREAISYVSAKAQAKLLGKLMDRLSEEEANVVRQGRNAKSQVPKNADVNDYRQATALEALVGYLYMENKLDRLREIAAVLFEERVHEDER
ncbi:MAG: ribonuclease III [Paenibacillus sp.]|uniref:Mini-ribonuclease 3 n=1 Tax=Paenibacillus aquistagni TaxID=1852522 RepID=A0A1X7M0Z0_9BACL|nr:ribonuclease III domain-containing protein [Paenibacillus aquistagni]MBR2570467.1 ribonuclease III [Paenibacillus sp.]SMG59183.1 ribonuclease-3 family protein [Paenibacillus aquistagni]